MPHLRAEGMRATFTVCAVAALLAGCPPAVMIGPALALGAAGANEAAREDELDKARATQAARRQAAAEEQRRQAEQDAAAAKARADAQAETERQQAAWDAAQAEQARQLAARANDPAWVRPLLSGYLCHYADQRGVAVHEIREEQRYAKELGGVYDMRKIYDLQSRVRKLDEESAKARATLAARKLKPLACDNADAKLVSLCLRQKEGEPFEPGCESERGQGFMELIRQ